HLLTEDLLDEIDNELDFPKQDPHGSPIPSKVGYPDHPLAQVKIGDTRFISQNQVSDHIMSELWELSLLPDSKVTVKSKSKEYIRIHLNGNDVDVNIDLAKMINTYLKTSDRRQQTSV
ncbi:MAG: hypothetical protein AAGK97_16220, partial [Bacteroidota bacterium]